MCKTILIIIFPLIESSEEGILFTPEQNLHYEGDLTNFNLSFFFCYALRITNFLQY